VGARDLDRAAAALRAAGFTAEAQDGRAFLQLRDPRALSDPDEVARVLVAADAAPTHLAVARETLEDHFIRLTGGQEAA
jgi:ABC-2 type transport system ATP-binding protein